MSKRTQAAAQVEAPVVTETVVTTEVASTQKARGLKKTYDFPELAKTHTTKSAMIRFLHSEGEEMGPISRALSTFYGKTMKFQHVRNVLTQKAKKD